MNYSKTLDRLYDKILKIFKKKEKNLNNGSKLEFEARDSDNYPYKESCDGFQNVWITENEKIKIEYINIEKIENIRNKNTQGDVVQRFRAPPCHGGSRGFESRHPRFCEKID